MIEADLIVVKLNTVARTNNEYVGPLHVTAETEFKPVVQHHFNTDLKGIAGYILVKFGDRLFQCERDNVDPTKPYIRHEIKYHPLAKLFANRVV